MCLGLPMTIIETDGRSALCEYGNQQRRISVMLLSEPSVGSKVLVCVDTAVRLLDADEARLIAQALDALYAILNGEDYDGFLADLIDHEPQLPEHLR
ncbi:HypC/HybG/HupF family hydrogenase formation chaperone [Bradyrhizobium sp. CCGB12]|uniref:HypC/HybG/HupF family hydrogenase formation chaperone n=1 Tax=Bradyrhizobium sp. CCGB12 TaxID=2949632 RepID=UPI0020B26D17|nr:HypC/HybG/HupF family hydrogenase formation chaperone [Bradyrhizobium sp. CCGB12]MCP3392452.1 HypC/HybG/HupF family hydrogenase formation chaperone [Bradyrhizobium sp. CCGB12]